MNSGGLTPKQIQLIKLLVNPDDTRTNDEKYAEVGISQPTAWRWSQKSEYLDAYREYTDKLLIPMRAKAVNQLGLEITGGDTSSARIRASEVLLRVTDDIGSGVNVQTHVTIQNEIEQKSDDELSKMIDEDRAAIARLEGVK